MAWVLIEQQILKAATGSQYLEFRLRLRETLDGDGAWGMLPCRIHQRDAHRLCDIPPRPCMRSRERGPSGTRERELSGL